MSKVIELLRWLVLPAILLGVSGCATPGSGNPVGLSRESRPPQDDGHKTQNKDGATGMAVLEVSYSFAEGRPTLHEPVVLRVVVKNTLARPVEIDLGADRKAGFLFAIKPPGGTTIKLPPLVREGISRSGRLTLEPGQTYNQELVLNEWYEFPAVGKYELSARLVASAKTPEGESLSEPAEFRTTLTVGPEDAERLRQVAAGLAEQITGAHSYEEAAEAALALGYVKDPVAVPYLEKALSAGHMVEPIVIAGLERIGGEDAIRALTAASASQDEETAELARAALDRVKGRQAHEER
jgi:hypothetical protein